MEHGYNISLVLMEHGYMRQGVNFFSSGKWHIDKFQAKLRISNICLRSSTGFNLINVSFYAILFQIRTFVENRILTQTFTPINQILLRFYQTSELKSILLAPLVKSLNFQTLSYLSRKMPPRREKKQGSTMGEVGHASKCWWWKGIIREDVIREKRFFVKSLHKMVTPPLPPFMKSLFIFFRKFSEKKWFGRVFEGCFHLRMSKKKFAGEAFGKII